MPMLENSDHPSFAGKIDEPKPFAAANKNQFIKYCGYATAIIVVLAAIAVVLASTVFRLRGPTVRLGNLTAGNIHGNVTLTADLWVRNPNFATIDYGNMTTTLFYRQVVVGESLTPPGRARARRTVMINASMEIMTDRILSQPDLAEDMLSGLVNLSSYTRVGGKINFAIFEKEMVMNMRCNLSVNVTSKKIQQHKCRKKIKL